MPIECKLAGSHTSFKWSPPNLDSGPFSLSQKNRESLTLGDNSLGSRENEYNGKGSTIMRGLLLQKINNQAEYDVIQFDKSSVLDSLNWNFLP